MTNAKIEHELRISYETIIKWTSFFREVCISDVLACSEPFGGNGVEVEIDGSKFGKKKYHRGHRVEGQWIFGDVKNITNQKSSWCQKGMHAGYLAEFLWFHKYNSEDKFLKTHTEN